MEDLARFCCQNSACAAYGRRNAGNLTVCGRFGKGRRIRLLYCRTCKKRGLFPPSTREVQCDEKWAFVAKKQPQCRDDEPAAVQAALERSRVSRRINTAFVERLHATDRQEHKR
jgi:hypothetical protein